MKSLLELLESFHQQRINPYIHILFIISPSLLESSYLWRTPDVISCPKIDEQNQMSTFMEFHSVTKSSVPQNPMV